MNEQQRFLLISNKKSIGDDLRPEDIFSYLQSKFTLNLDEVEIIKHEKTSRRKTEKLLSLLPDKGSSAFAHFHDALIDAGYEHLADLLASGIDGRQMSIESESGDDDIQSVETILRDGGVPQRPAVHAKRPEELKQLREALYSLKRSDGWVLLHGMAGSGKTVLASEVLADRELLQDCFPGGVFWVSIGVIDAARLLMKMQNLCSWLDPEKMHQAPRNLEEARDRIRILFAHEHPRSLLVLDDLWTKEDARFFDVRARTLATSRNDFIAENITGSVLKVHIEEGFTEDQSMTVLSQWTHIARSSLPAEAVSLIKACQGSPLAISMIGALLRGRSNRWEYYLKQLQDHKVSKLKSRLAYEHPNLHDAIAISVNSLNDDVKNKYEFFAVFEEDSRIPGKVLGLLWNEDDIDVEDTMDELISRSLAKRHPPSKDVPFETYSVHDLQLDYLKESRGLLPGSRTLSDLHLDLVQKYAASCDSDFAAIPDDGYVYWNIINHLIEAKLTEKAVELLLSFPWIESKLLATGAPDLINSYHKVMQLVGDDTMNELRDYVHFIGINSYILSTPGHQEYDLIQLALSQPFATRVHARAKNIVSSLSEKDKFYVGWCNKPDGSSETCLLTVKHHSGPVYCCHWANNGSDRIVSCGGDGIIKIWNACTGQIYSSLVGHQDTVYCCQFSPDATKIVSSSADRTVKVWEADTGQPLLTLKGHAGDVYCCTFNPADRNIIASCSTDTDIKIWDIANGVLIKTLSDHEDTVNWCCFSPDGKNLASASNDFTLKIWDVASGKCIASSCWDTVLISYCIYHPSGKTILATSQNFFQFLDAQTGNPLKKIQTMCSVLSIAFSPDGKYAVGTYADSTAQLWDVEAEVCMGIFRGHSGWLHSSCYAPEGKRIVTASADETCKVWKVEPMQDRAVKLRKVFDAKFEGLPRPIIIAANTSHEVQVIDGANGNYLGRSLPLGAKITACKLNFDGDTIIVGLKNGRIKLINVETCKEIASFSDQLAAVTDCAVSDDRVTLVTCSENKAIKVWNLKEQILSVECHGHTDEVTKCQLFNHHRRVVTASFDGTIKVWEIDNGQCLFTCHHNDNNAVLSCAVSPDDRLLVSTSAGSTAKLWNAETGEILHKLIGHNDCVRCASFSPDSAVVATGSDDSTIKIWDTKTGENLTTCKGHKVWVTDVRFSSDGNSFVSVSSDIKWWRRDGSLLQTFLVRGNYLRQIKVSHDFKKFITIDDTGQLYILDAI